MKPKVQIFTDGSCPRPQDAGGWALIMRLESGKEIKKTGGALVTTNNRMELTPVIEAFKILKGTPCEVILTSDSQYVLKGISEWLPGWKKAHWKMKNHETKKIEDRPNKDLWQALDLLMKGHVVKTNWVKGHSGHIYNEEVDFLAKQQTEKYRGMK